MTVLKSKMCGGDILSGHINSVEVRQNQKGVRVMIQHLSNKVFILLTMIMLLLCSSALAEAWPESSHPYEKYTDMTWVYTHIEEADYLKITFSEESKLGNSGDRIWITAEDGTTYNYSTYTWETPAGVTVILPGNSFSIGLIADGILEDYGFSFTEITAMTQTEYDEYLYLKSIPESEHPYANNESESWSYTHPKETDYLKIQFSDDTRLEAGCDTIVINGNGKTQRYTGWDLAGRAIYVSGNHFSLNLYSNGYNNFYGFRITEITNATQEEYDDYMLNVYQNIIPESEHSYLSYSDASWGYTYPQEADYLRITFSEDTYVESGNDFIYINKGLTTEQKFTGRELADRVVYVEGQTFNIRLTSNYSNHFYGFKINEIVGVTKEEYDNHVIFKRIFDITQNGVVTAKTRIDGVSFICNEQYLEIPSRINGIKVKRLASYWKDDRIQTIVLPEGLTSIASGAFTNCNYLTDVYLPESIALIEDAAFVNCGSLENIHVENLASWIGITFETPKSTPMNYADNLYVGGQLLTEAVIPEGITSIGDYAFYNCSNLTSVTLPDSVTSIGSSAFYNCSSLTSITIPDGVTSIGSSAFYNCSSLTSVYADSLESWLAISFADSYSNPIYYAYNLYFGNELAVNLTVPDNIDSIGEYAFYNCSSLTSVSIPDGVTSIGFKAFYNCNGLTQIILPSSVTSIGEYAFRGCSNLRFVQIPERVVSDSPYVDYSYGTFGLYFPPTLEANVIITDGTKTIGKMAFKGCSYLTSITIPDSVTSIKVSAFEGCSSLTSIILPDNVTSIGAYAFADCSSLNSIVVPDSVASIGNSAFYGCSSLTSISISEGVTTIGKYAFYGCSSLTSISIPDSVTSIDYSTFAGCSNLASVSLSNSITSISPYMFQDCSKLATITIPSGVKTIGEYAFDGCNRLSKVVIPDTVTSIGKKAFEMYLKTIVFLGYTMPSLGEDAFDYYINSLPTIYCYEFSEVEFWAANEQLKVTYIDSMDMTVPWTLTLPADHELTVGESVYIQADVFPAQDSSRIEWISSAPHVVSVENGKLSALSAGKATITASCGGISDSMVITAYADIVSFDLTTSELWIVSKTTAQLSVQNILPLGAEGSFVWESSDSGKCTVDSSGLLSGLVPGDVIVTATSNNGIVRACTVHVCYPITAIEFAEKDYSLVIGSKIQLTANVTMRTQSCVNQLVKFSSSENSVATVDETGLLKAVGIGTAIITASSDNGITATCTIEVSEHEHIAEVDSPVEPTCTEVGWTEGTHCSLCNKVLVAQTQIPALGHTEVIDEAVVPTCAETGLSEGKHCSVCGEILVEQVILEKHSDTIAIDQAALPTCTETGLTEGRHCSVCGEILLAQEIVPELGHTEEIDAEVLPNCTETGLTEGKHCSVCSEVLAAQGSVPALGHTSETDEAVLPTCTGTGLTEGSHCAVCGEVLNAQTDIAALGHTEITDEAIAPNCTETGLTEGKHCSVCHEILIAQEVISATGHTRIEIPGIEATDFTEGMTTGVECSVCGEILTACKPISALCVVKNGVLTKYNGTTAELVIPADLGVASIAEDAFKNNVSLISISIPEGVTSIDPFAFYGCTALEQVKLPDTLQSIGIYAFSGCSSLTNVSIPDGVQVGHGAFDAASDTNPETGIRMRNRIGEDLRYVCFDNGTWILYGNGEPFPQNSSDNMQISAWDGWVSNKVYYVNENIPVKFVVENGVTEIADSMLAYVATLEEVVLPDSITHIGNKAFSGCTALKKINLPENLKSIDASALTNCPDVVATVAIGSYAHEWCIANGVRFKCSVHTEIVDEAVVPTCTATGLTEGKHCDRCEEVLVKQEIVPTMGHTVSMAQDVCETTVGSEVIAEVHFLCGHETAINWISSGSGKVEFVGISPDESSTKNSAAVFTAKSAGITTVTAEFADGITESCTCTVIVHSEQQMILPAALHTLEDEAFLNASIQEFILPNGIKQIGDRVFAGCSDLVIVHMPDSIESIADNAFEGCKNVAFICASENAAVGYAAEHDIPVIIY